MRWADRVHKHFYNDGALTDERILQRYQEMRAEMSGVLPNMSTLIENTWIPNRRRNIMQQFRTGGSRVLITTDLLSRGIDVQQVSVVINYDLPRKLENYLHRIGRSGRFGNRQLPC